MSKPLFRVIGDVHGMTDPYVEIAKDAECSLQLGDLGFNYDCLKDLDPERHKVLAGNHDNYAKWETSKFIHMQTGHWLGDYGVYSAPGFGDIFFARGGFSIDWQYRREGKTWWRDEEMSGTDMSKALEMYLDLKPDFVVSHECPGSIIDLAFGQKTWDGEQLRPSMTAKMLDMMWNGHKPKTWLFGHHHKTWTEEIRGTVFRCIPELGFVDFDKDKVITHVDDGK